MSKNDFSVGIVCFIVIVMVIVGFVGWSMNIYKFSQLDFKSPYAAESIRGIGIFVPFVGAVEGYINIQD